MLEDGADPETPIQYTSNSKGVCKPLHSASIGGSLKMIELLLTYKAKINSIDYYSREPLHLAVGTDRFDCVKLLLENGADHSPKDELGRTPLHYAVEYGLLSMTKYLLDQGASPDGLPDIKSPYPLAVAARARQPEIAQLLVDKGATVDCRDANLSTPFIIAAWWGSLRVMRILVKHGAAFDAVDKGGDQAIAFAADGNPKYENDYINIISFLLGCGADIDHADSKGWTALHFATIEGKINTVRFLLEQGALHRLEAQAHYEVIHGEKKGSRVYGTPLNMAKMLGYTAIIKELEDFDKFKSKSM
jgi:ankyrin repeat protein